MEMKPTEFNSNYPLDPPPPPIPPSPANSPSVNPKLPHPQPYLFFPPSSHPSKNKKFTEPPWTLGENRTTGPIPIVQLATNYIL